MIVCFNDGNDLIWGDQKFYSPVDWDTCAIMKKYDGLPVATRSIATGTRNEVFLSIHRIH